MTTPTCITPQRRAFSLMELLIVLAILAVIVGMSWPALQKPWHKSRLNSAAKKLQSELGRARVAAIESGSVQQFRYQPGTPRFASQAGMTIALTSDSRTDLDAAVSSDSDQQYLDTMEMDKLVIDELPSGVIFQDPNATEHDNVSSDEFSEDQTVDMSSGDEGQMPWSKPITFYPNGRVTGGRIRLADRHGYYIDVTMRGLTGTAKIGSVMRRELATGEEGSEEEPLHEESGETADRLGESLPVPPAVPAPLEPPAPLKPSSGSGGP
ncbi:MAG: prepilin-type N-terminal cleavage/methylation domain-containing protein [Pirellulales bacterium]|nr:prepilin-type N-terminal cleavage/methylation domain-containing protein [Pirellulales bacterium]